VFRSGPTLEPTQPVAQRISGDLATGVKRLRPEADYLTYQPPALRMTGADVSSSLYTFMKCTRTNLDVRTEEK
jgi:hypothetical protein